MGRPATISCTGHWGREIPPEREPRKPEDVDLHTCLVRVRPAELSHSNDVEMKNARGEIRAALGLKKEQELTEELVGKVLKEHPPVSEYAINRKCGWFLRTRNRRKLRASLVGGLQSSASSTLAGCPGMPAPKETRGRSQLGAPKPRGLRWRDGNPP